MAFGDPDFPVRTDDPYTNYLVDLGVKVVSDDPDDGDISPKDLGMPPYEKVRAFYEEEVVASGARKHTLSCSAFDTGNEKDCDCH